MIVLDASAGIEWLLRLPLAAAVERRLLVDGHTIHIPHLWFVEVTQVIRRHVLSNQLDQKRAGEALADAADLPAVPYPHEPLGPRMWSLRNTMTAYDATYIALAEALDATLVTSDASLTRATGHSASIDLVG